MTRDDNKLVGILVKGSVLAGMVREGKILPKLPIGLWVEMAVGWAQVNLDTLFDFIT